MNDEPTIEPRKLNRRLREERDRLRPIVHGALPYHGHRPRAKDERKRIASVVSKARKHAR